MSKALTVIIPCYNEEKYIAGVIDSILNNDYPKELMEVFIVDGMSTDRTREVVAEYAKNHDFIFLIDNKDKYVPYAMNNGIKMAKGKIIIRMDAHCIYPKDYISKLIYYSDLLNAENVGGALITCPGADTLKAKAISLCLSTSFGVGNSLFRLTNHKKEYIETNTVPFGCYKKEIFDKIGFYDTELKRSQDFEFNERILSNGGKIYLIPSIKLKYYVRDTYSKLAKMLFQYGYFTPLVDYKLKRVSKLRKYIPPIFFMSLAIPTALSVFYLPLLCVSGLSLALHTAASVVFTLKTALQEKQLAVVPYLMAAYLTAHISYGIGFIKGTIDFLLLKKHKKNFEIGGSR